MRSLGRCRQVSEMDDKPEAFAHTHGFQWGLAHGSTELKFSSSDSWNYVCHCCNYEKPAYGSCWIDSVVRAVRSRQPGVTAPCSVAVTRAMRRSSVRQLEPCREACLRCAESVFLLPYKCCDLGLLPHTVRGEGIANMNVPKRSYIAAKP